MQKVILDTDIGIDCDDAAALGVLLELEAQGVCKLEGIVTSTTREGAAETIQAILDYYHVKKEIGVMREPTLPCDSENTYAKAMKERYGGERIWKDSAEVLRGILRNTTEKVVIIAIGPLSNIANLLKSDKELVKKTVSCIYIMGGSFLQYDVKGNPTNIEAMQEWNFLQDIESAAYVMKECPCEMVLCPWECGNQVFTCLQEGENPVWYAMKSYVIATNRNSGQAFSRESWDPVTCLAALQDCNRFLDVSDKGYVTVEKDGTTNFETHTKGNTRFLKSKGNYEEFGQWIDSLIRL